MISIFSKRAFTLLEVIMVIVILGIVSSVGASIIADVYESYILQRALHNASSKTDLAAKQIAARLANRIPQATIGRNPDTGGYLLAVDLPPGDQYKILEWIGYDYDSFTAAATPGWSGYCDINASTINVFSTPGSNLNLTSTIITNLGGTVADAAVIFSSNFFNNSPTQMYHPAYMGFGTAKFDNPAKLPTGITVNTISTVAAFPTTASILVNDTNPKSVYDKYRLVWSAYAIVPEVHPDNDQLFDLALYYNYQPWQGAALGVEGENYTNGIRKLLVTDVTVFKIRAIGDTIRFKICVQEQIGDGSVNICKEKAVIR